MKKRVKKYVRRAVWCAGIVLVLCCCADIALRVVSSRARVRRFVTQQIERATGRQVELDRLYVSLLGLRISGFKMSEAGGFENGTFASVDKLSAGFSLAHLLRKHIALRNVAVHGLSVRLIKNADGSLSTDDLSSASEKPELPADPEKTFGWGLSWRRLQLDDSSFVYQDDAAGAVAQISQFFLEAHRLSLRKDFDFASNWQASYRAPDRETLSVSGGVTGTLNLGELNLSKAFLRVKGLVLRYADTPLTLSGTVENFVAPSADLTLRAENFSNHTLAAFAPDLPAFTVPQMSLRIKALADTVKQSFTLNYLAFSMPGADAAALGGALYGERPDYDFQLTANLNLAQLATLSPELEKAYQPAGAVGIKASVVPQALKADVTVSDVAAHIAGVGRLAGVGALIKVNGADDVQLTKLEGRLNEKAFTGSASYLDKKDFRNVGLWLKLDGLTLMTTEEESDEAWARHPDAAYEPPAEEPAAEQTPAVKQTAAQKTEYNAAFVPLNVKLAVESGPVQARYFYTNTMNLDVSLSGVTPDLHTAHGTVRLNLSEGEIRDIYKLTEANAVTKVLFMSLNVVSRVINSLNVVGLLSSLTGAENAVSGDKRPKTAGEMPFDSFDAVMDFNHGSMTMKQGSFVSDMMSLKISGNTDFATGKVDMQVNAAPGKHYEDGIMPITIAVGGTVDEPKGSVSMLSSAAALVTQSVTNNFASNAVKKGVGGIFGLFKKKQTPQPEASPDEFIPIDPSAVLAAEEAAVSRETAAASQAVP